MKWAFKLWLLLTGGGGMLSIINKHIISSLIIFIHQQRRRRLLSWSTLNIYLSPFRISCTTSSEASPASKQASQQLPTPGDIGNYACLISRPRLSFRNFFFIETNFPVILNLIKLHSGMNRPPPQKSTLLTCGSSHFVLVLLVVHCEATDASAGAAVECVRPELSNIRCTLFFVSLHSHSESHLAIHFTQSYQPRTLHCCTSQEASQPPPLVSTRRKSYLPPKWRKWRGKDFFLLFRL